MPHLDHLDYRIEGANIGQMGLGLTQTQINQFPLVNWKLNSIEVQTDI